MTLLFTLASEAAGAKTWWNPYLKGGVITVMAVGLFVGSAYLLLYTNVGSRLGFLLTATAFFGFITVLSVFWIMGQFPNGPLGKEPGWPVEEILADPAESAFGPVPTIERGGNEADGGSAGQIRSSLDEALTDPESPHKLFDKPADFLTVQTLIEGGGRKWPMWWTEKTTYGVSELCPPLEVKTLPLDPPPVPTCDTTQATTWVVVVKDLGARRLPSLFFFGGSGLLFLLSLGSLRRYERELQRAAEDGGDAGRDDESDGPGPDDDDDDEPAQPEPATT